MASFALITEGLTDQVALAAIIEGHYGDVHDIVEAQPIRDATDRRRQGSYAGWEQVIEFCSVVDFAAVFAVNDYAIIQIDLDICDHVKVNIPLVDENGDNRSPLNLIEDMKEYIISKIDKGLYEQVSDRIIFAIAYHSLECWVLALIAQSPRDKRTIRQCETRLRYLRGRSNQAYQKDYRCYLELTRDFSKTKRLESARNFNESLAVFLESLPEIAEV